jgi:hypothetical protein
MAKKKSITKKDSEIIKIGNEKFKKTAFLIEEDHPALGRLLIVDGVKFRVMDYAPLGGHRTGTYIRRLNEEDEKQIQEYEDALDLLSEKLVDKVDVKRMIKENIRTQPITEIKTGLYILDQEDKGMEIEANHKKGCYQLDLHSGLQTFSFITGRDLHQISEVTDIETGRRL